MKSATAAAEDAPPALLGSPERFINRELSWLEFNRRVLEESANPQPSAARAAAVPVDLGQQPRRILHGPRRRPARPGARGRDGRSPRTGLRPAEQLRAHRRAGRRTGRRAAAALARSCATSSTRPGIVIVDAPSVADAERQWLEDYFLLHVFPVLTPLAVDPAHPFPFIPNLGFTLALELEQPRRPARA